MKKILSLILALLMIVSCASFIFAEEAAPAEDTAVVTTAAPAAAADDETASKYYDAVKFLVDNKIMHGKGEKLGVYDNIKRYEMALFLGRICTGWVADDQWEDGPENTSNFVDLKGTAAENYYGAISFVKGKGIIEGVGGNKFAPEAGIKYEDALTMAVRTLGYTDLAYPWGYIEKAVNLGVTAGIDGVAYSEELKREVVAQIIYNLLFIENAEGTTLAKKNFDLSLNDAIVMITACDGGYYTAKAALAPAGYVAYQEFNADGSLGGKVYYAKAEAFGLTGEHDDEKALGGLFACTFNNSDANLGELVSAKSLEMEPVCNEGINSKEAGKYPIQNLLSDLKIVSKYSSAYNANANQIIIAVDDGESTIVVSDRVAIDWLSGDILVKNGEGVYEIAWYYNQLLQVYFRYKEVVNENGEMVLAGIEYMTEEDIDALYNLPDITYTASSCFTAIDKIAPTAYAQLRVFDANGDGVADYGIYDAYRLGKVSLTAPVLDYSVLTSANIGDHYTDTLQWIAIGALPDEPRYYRTTFTQATEKYVNEGFNVFDYSEVPNGGAPFGTLTLLNTKMPELEGEVFIPGIVTFQNGGKGKDVDVTHMLTLDSVWFTNGEAPAEGDWVIYGANPSTNEVNIVKTLKPYEEGAESYIATGIVRAYSTAKKTITIGDQTFSTSYDDLTGSTFTSANYRDGVWYKGSEYLHSLLNQFVTYIVVDEKVVYAELNGNEDFRFLIVSSFAGISSDGFLVINAWDTADGKNKQFRISSVDGWEFGDYFYYSGNYDTYYKIFEEDTVLQITSYVPEEDAYCVTEAVGLNSLPKQQGFTYSADKNSVSMSGEQTCKVNGRDFVWFMIDYRFCKTDIQFYIYQGKYRPAPTSWGDGDTAWAAAGGGSIPTGTNGLTKNMEEEKFIMIFAPGEIAGSPVRIWEGKVTNSDWSIQGWRLVGTDAHTHIYMGLKAGNVKGFGIDQTATNHTLVMIPDYRDKNGRGENGAPDLGSWYRPELGSCAGWQIQWGNSGEYFINADQHPWGYVISAAYDEEVPHKDWYLLGNTEYDVVVLNLRTLHTETVKVSDKNMKANFIYECIDGKVVGEPHRAGELYELLLGTFGNNACDLENDLTEMFTTYCNLNDRLAAHESGCNNDNWIHKEYTALQINNWMSQKWLGTAYADFGSYLVNREWANNAAVAIYEGKDGHVELTVLGMGGGKNYTTPFGITKNNNYGEYPIATDRNKMNPSERVQHMLTGKNDRNVDVVAVTLINLDNVRLQRNLDPYGSGLAVITYLFDQKIVGTINHAFDKYPAN